MDQILIAKLRPAAWRVYVQGREEARRVQQNLQKAGLQTSQPAQLDEEPDIFDPSVYSFVASAHEMSPLTREELIAVLQCEPQVRVSLPLENGDA